MAPPPVLGDGDEPLGTGVLGDVGGGAAHQISGDVTAHANTYGIIKHSFRGADGDRPHARRRDKQRSWDRVVAAKKARDRHAAQEEAVARQKRQRAAWAAEQKRLADRAKKQAELEALALRLYAVKQAKRLRDEEDIAVLLLVA